ncbi:putative holin-like toxin [uncultured Veillonella sp.]
MTTYESLSIMIDFSILIVAIITIMITIFFNSRK